MSKEKSFEESMTRLEGIVKELESGNKPLDETIQLFEEGLTLVKDCNDQLQQFKVKVQEISRGNGAE